MSVTERDVLEVIVAAEDGTVSTMAVAEALDISHPGAWRRLEKLEDAGLLVRAPGGETETDTWALSEDARAAIAEEE